MRVLAFDVYPNEALASKLGFEYQALDAVLAASDIISLHIPLNADTLHIMNANRLQKMKKGSILINTSRGGLVDTQALISEIKSRHLGAVGLDVYEMEEGVFFENQSYLGIDDDQLARLITFPNVLITSHQGYLTKEALSNIASTTLQSVDEYSQGLVLSAQIQLP
jgi:D-lactate dehydrogenase